jgi:ABC-2 type transport system ATP-binding protein
MSVGNSTNIVELRGVKKIFRDFWMRARVTAVRDLSLTVRPGEVVGLLGPNGSGKSTTIKMILGLLYPTRGQIAVLGRRPTDVKLKHRIGYLPEESWLYRFLNAEETLDFYGRLFHLPRAERQRRTDMLLEMVGLDAARYRTMGEYSKGMQRRIGLAQALINDPDLLILDEPTTGMDPIATKQIKDLLLNLRSRGKTIILCTHLLSEVEDVCSRLAIMYGGRLRAEGTVDELLSMPNLQRIDLDPLGSETIVKLERWLQEEAGARIHSIETPRQRLESLFLDVVRSAEDEGVQTSGATAGGKIAGFLAEPTGDRLLQQLVTREEAKIPPVVVQRVVETMAAPDEALLSQIASIGSPASRDITARSPKADDTESATVTTEPDRELLQSLTAKETASS